MSRVDFSVQEIIMDTAPYVELLQSLNVLLSIVVKIDVGCDGGDTNVMACEGETKDRDHNSVVLIREQITSVFAARLFELCPGFVSIGYFSSWDRLSIVEIKHHLWALNIRLATVLLARSVAVGDFSCVRDLLEYLDAMPSNGPVATLLAPYAADLRYVLTMINSCNFTELLELQKQHLLAGANAIWCEKCEKPKVQFSQVDEDCFFIGENFADNENEQLQRAIQASMQAFDADKRVRDYDGRDLLSDFKFYVQILPAIYEIAEDLNAVDAVSLKQVARFKSLIWQLPEMLFANESDKDAILKEHAALYETTSNQLDLEAFKALVAKTLKQLRPFQAQIHTLDIIVLVEEAIESSNVEKLYQALNLMSSKAEGVHEVFLDYVARFDGVRLEFLSMLEPYRDSKDQVLKKALIESNVRLLDFINGLSEVRAEAIAFLQTIIVKQRDYEEDMHGVISYSRDIASLSPGLWKRPDEEVVEVLTAVANAGFVFPQSVSIVGVDASEIRDRIALIPAGCAKQLHTFADKLEKKLRRDPNDLRVHARKLSHARVRFGYRAPSMPSIPEESCEHEKTPVKYDGSPIGCYW